jgi:hypothetical protein
MRKLLLLAAFAALACPAHSQPAPLASPPAEVRHARVRLFISPSGEPFRGPDGLAAWFAEADADHDGAITLAEFQADAERAFRLYDSDGDGVLDGLEIQAYERQRAPEISELAFGGDAPRAGRRGPRNRRGSRDGPVDAAAQTDGRPGDTARFRGAGATGAARFSLLNEPEPLLAADADIDGKVTRAEWARSTARRFTLLDRDSAGRLTLIALRTPPAKH